MARISRFTAIRTQDLFVKKTAPLMPFSRIVSTIQMPETLPLKHQCRDTWSSNNLMFVSDKSPLSKTLDASEKSIFSSEVKSIILALQKGPTNTTDASENHAPSFDIKGKKVPEIVKKYNELIASQDPSDNAVEPRIERGRSASWPNITNKMGDSFPSIDNEPGVGKVNSIGQIFSPDNLMYSASLQKTADKYGVVIGVRLPSEVGQIHLKEGHPTKNFHVKAKSSAMGPTAGFIAENPKFSKMRPELWDKQQKYIEEALSKGAKLVPLILSEAQIDNAINRGGMHKIGQNMFSADYHGNKVHFIISSSDGMVRESNGTVVKVLTNPLETDGSTSIDKPITADYDLFAIIPKKNHSVNFRPLGIGHNIKLRTDPQKLNVPPKDYLQSGGKKAFKNAVDTFIQPKIVHGQEDPNMGNIHHFGNVIVNDINKNVVDEGFSGGKLVWHNDETGNPFSPGFDVKDKPVFYIPKQAPQQITDMKQLSAFYNELKKNGFAPEFSSRLGM